MCKIILHLKVVRRIHPVNNNLLSRHLIPTATSQTHHQHLEIMDLVKAIKLGGTMKQKQEINKAIKGMNKVKKEINQVTKEVNQVKLEMKRDKVCLYT